MSLNETRAAWLLACVIGTVWSTVTPPKALADAVNPTSADIARRISERVVDRSADFADDTTFLRRVTIDLTGRIPTVAEVHEFLSDSSSSRREKAVDRLMASGVYYRSMATFWRRAWVPQADTREFASVTTPFEAWLAIRLRDGARYDELVTETLTQDPEGKSSVVTGPKGFFDANLAKPESLAASAARAFLGLNLDCAQCHDHPHARWTREQFWQTAAFFSRPSAAAGKAGLPRIRIPDTAIDCEPAFLTDTLITVPSTSDSVTLRQTFVQWMLADADRLVAKNAVNRLWSHFFGKAIIEPLDDLTRKEFQTGPQAELLRELADLFIASGYDLDAMIKGMVTSDAYRLVATAPATAPDMATGQPAAGSVDAVSTGLPGAEFTLVSVPVRALTGEQLADSLIVASGLPMDRNDVLVSDRQGGRDALAAEFFVERTHAAERSITQALTLMNGSFVTSLSTAEGNRILAALLTSPFMSADQQIDTVFVAVLGRHARAGEREAVQRRFDASSNLSREEQLGGLFWALFNSAEFCTNH